MNRKKLTPYRLPISILVFFIASWLSAHPPLVHIAFTTSFLIGEIFSAYDPVKEIEQIALIYAILFGVIAHYVTGKFIGVDALLNKKGLFKGVALVVLITMAYIYNIVY